MAERSMVEIRRGRGTEAWRSWSRTQACPAKVGAFTKACRVAVSIARKGLFIQLSIRLSKKRYF